MYTCPVCGYTELSEPPYNSLGGGSYEICYSCGYEYGVTDDDDEISHEEWRSRWINDGMQWYSKYRDKPEHWNPKAQLFRIGVKVD